MDENTTIEQRIPALNHPTPKVNRLRAARDEKEHRGRTLFASILNAAVPATDGEVANPTKPPRKKKKIAATAKDPPLAAPIVAKTSANSSAKQQAKIQQDNADSDNDEPVDLDDETMVLHATSSNPRFRATIFPILEEIGFQYTKSNITYSFGEKTFEGEQLVREFLCHHGIPNSSDLTPKKLKWLTAWVKYVRVLPSDFTWYSNLLSDDEMVTLLKAKVKLVHDQEIFSSRLTLPVLHVGCLETVRHTIREYGVEAVHATEVGRKASRLVRNMTGHEQASLRLWAARGTFGLPDFGATVPAQVATALAPVQRAIANKPTSQQGPCRVSSEPGDLLSEDDDESSLSSQTFDQDVDYEDEDEASEAVSPSEQDFTLDIGVDKDQDDNAEETRAKQYVDRELG